MDIFQISSKAANTAPGKGAGEQLQSVPKAYAGLAKIPHWRRILSNFAQTPFTWKGKRWNTLEHAFHAAKFETLRPDLFESFSLDSGSELSQGGGEEARKQRKAYVFQKEEQAEWDSRRNAVQEELWRAKFSQFKDAQHILLLTHPAQLWHSAPRLPKEHWVGLEKLREEFRQTQAQTNAPVQEAEMQAVPTASKKPRAAPKSKKAAASAAEATEDERPVSNVGAGPESVVAEEFQVSPGVRPPNMEEPEKKVTSIRLCPKCDYYLYTQVEGEDQTLSRLCRVCGYKEQDTTGGLVIEMRVHEKSAEGYKILVNEYTQKDPALPHIRKNIKCPNGVCDSNRSGVDPDIIYLKYDNVNLLYMYICNIPGCGYRWKSANR